MAIRSGAYFPPPSARYDENIQLLQRAVYSDFHIGRTKVEVASLL